MTENNLESDTKHTLTDSPNTQKKYISSIVKKYIHDNFILIQGQIQKNLVNQTQIGTPRKRDTPFQTHTRVMLHFHHLIVLGMLENLRDFRENCESTAQRIPPRRRVFRVFVITVRNVKLSFTWCRLISGQRGPLHIFL